MLGFPFSILGVGVTMWHIYFRVGNNLIHIERLGLHYRQCCSRNHKVLDRDRDRDLGVETETSESRPETKIEIETSDKSVL